MPICGLCGEWAKAKEDHKCAPEDEVRVDTLGYVQNGIVTEATKCIGCGNYFEELYYAGQSNDGGAVCGGCEKTMEP